MFRGVFLSRANTCAISLPAEELPYGSGHQRLTLAGLFVFGLVGPLRRRIETVRRTHRPFRLSLQR